MENKVVRLPEEKRQEIIERLSTEEKFPHGVFGRFDFGVRGGHFLQEVKGDGNLIRKIFKNEEVYDKIFGGKTGGTEFMARLATIEFEGDVVFVLSFNDRQGDKRSGSHTDFALALPKEESDLVDIINGDPQIVIEVFKKVFPKYDRSAGRLNIEPNSKTLQMQMNK